MLLIGRRHNQLITRFNGPPMWDTPLTTAQTGGATCVPLPCCEAKGSHIRRVLKPVIKARPKSSNIENDLSLELLARLALSPSESDKNVLLEW